jgi:hypothetical protein
MILRIRNAGEKIRKIVPSDSRNQTDPAEHRTNWHEPYDPADRHASECSFDPLSSQSRNLAFQARFLRSRLYSRCHRAAGGYSRQPNSYFFLGFLQRSHPAHFRLTTIFRKVTGWNYTTSKTNECKGKLSTLSFRC